MQAHTGDFVHQVDIMVPKHLGRAPELALIYHSGAGNGMVGLGWTLVGFPSIDRRSEGGGMPSLASSDVWYAEGARLMPCGGAVSSASCAAGGTHVRRIENFRRYRFDGESVGWTVTDKDGTRYLYNKPFSVAGATTRWLLGRVVDPIGNATDYTYLEDAGKYTYPSSVSYNGNTVRFVYEDRPDSLEIAEGAGLVTIGKRLKAVSVSNLAGMIRAYALNYSQSPGTSDSLLISTQLFGNDAVVSAAGAVSGSALPKESYLWNETGAQSSTPPGFMPVSTQGGFDGSSASGVGQWFADLDGDGSADFVKMNWADGVLRWNISNSNGTWGERRTQGGFPLPGRTLDFGSVWNCEWVNVWVPDPVTGGTFQLQYQCGWSVAVSTTEFHVWFVDLNGDGKADYVTKEGNQSGLIRWAFSNGNGFDAPQADGDLPWINSGKSFMADINRDGRADFIVLRHDGSVEWSIWNGSSFDPVQGRAGALPAGGQHTLTDINADGYLDLVRKADDGNLSWALGTGSGLSNTQWAAFVTRTGMWDIGDNDQFWFADINDDRTPDYITIVGNEFRWNLNYGGSFGPNKRQSGLYSGAPGNSGFADINGDGRADFFRRDTDRVIWVLSNGTGWQAPASLGGVTTELNMVAVADVNGDGRDDFLAVTQAGALQQALTSGHYSRVVIVDNANGGGQSIGYLPSSLWPNANMPFTHWTVGMHIVRDRPGTGAITYHDYSGGLYDFKERRFLGYKQVKKTLPCTPTDGGICPREITEYAQDFGSISKPSRVDRYGKGVLLASKIYTYKTNGSNLPYRSVPESEWAYAYDSASPGTCPGSNCKRSYSGFTHDDYGNLRTTVSLDNFDAPGDETYQVVDFAYNPTAYIVGLPARTVTYAGQNAGAPKLAEVQALYDGAASYLVPPLKGLTTKVLTWDDNGTPSTGDDSYVVSETRYNANGSIWKSIDPMLRETTYEYDATYRVFPQRVVNALGQVVTSVYLPRCEMPERVVGLNGDVTTTRFDAFCRKTREDRPLGGFSTWSYCQTGSVDNPCRDTSRQFVREETNSADGSGNLWKETYFDGLGRTWKTQSKGPDGKVIVVNQSYHTRGMPYLTSNPYYLGETPLSTKKDYDGLDRLTKTTHPDIATATIAYGAWKETRTDELGRVTTVLFNAAGKEVELGFRWNGSAHRTRYSLDALHRVTGVTDAAGNVFAYTYSSRNLLTKYIDPNSGTSTFQYWADDQPRRKTDAMGQVTSLAYDALGRKKTETLRSGTAQAQTTTFVYDEPRSGHFNAGKLTTMLDSTGDTRNDHDLAGRVVRSIKTINGVEYAFEYGFDAGGRQLWIKYPDGDRIGTAADPLRYNGAGQPLSIPGVIASAAYNANGALSSIAYVNGVMTRYGYDSGRSLLTSIKTHKDGTVLQDNVFKRNSAGLITSIASPFAGEGWSAFFYDELGRLEAAVNASNPFDSQAFGYDVVGNIRSNSLVGAYRYNESGPGSVRPNAVLAAGAMNFDYDANGDMINRNGVTLVRDGSGRMVKAGNVEYAYDGAGKRVRANGVIFPSEDVEVRLIPIARGDYPSFVPNYSKHVRFGSKLVARKKGGEWEFIHPNHLNSPQVLTTAGGAVIGRMTYRPFGERYGANASGLVTRGFLGERVDDETGLVFQRVRYFDPVIGRYTSADPASVLQPNVGINRYSFASNDPINYQDSGFATMVADHRNMGAVQNFMIESRQAGRPLVVLGVGILNNGNTTSIQENLKFMESYFNANVIGVPNIGGNATAHIRENYGSGSGGEILASFGALMNAALGNAPDTQSAMLRQVSLMARDVGVRYGQVLHSNGNQSGVELVKDGGFARESILWSLSVSPNTGGYGYKILSSGLPNFFAIKAEDDDALDVALLNGANYSGNLWLWSNPGKGVVHNQHELHEARANILTVFGAGAGPEMLGNFIGWSWYVNNPYLGGAWSGYSGPSYTTGSGVSYTDYSDY